LRRFGAAARRTGERRSDKPSNIPLDNEQFLAVSYTADGSSGLALFGGRGDEWSGVGTYAGTTSISTETWTKQ
jgi:hypothetical protein